MGARWAYHDDVVRMRRRSEVLIIDEAHLLDHEQLEAVRMLTLCRGRDYAGDAHGGRVAQPVRATVAA